MNRLPAPLLVVTDRAGDAAEAGGHLLRNLDRLLGAGLRWIWFRERDMAPEARRDLAHEVAARVRERGGVLSIGGDPALAAELDAGGVHLPGGGTARDIEAARALLPRGLIGVSAHGPDEVDAAASAGADYATLSPIYPTASKPGYGPALGLAAIRRAAASGLPVIALGGITPERVPDCLAAGAAACAVMGGLMHGDDPVAEARRYLAALGNR